MEMEAHSEFNLSQDSVRLQCARSVQHQKKGLADPQNRLALVVALEGRPAALPFTVMVP